jgi:hypothetical protein
MRLAARPIALALALVLLPATALQAQEFSSIEERMSGAEYRAAGLDKLSDEELAVLNRWIRDNLSGSPQQASGVAPAGIAPTASADRRGFPQDGGGEDIVSRIVGEFSGWSGSGQRITLENGMVWETTDPSSRLAVRLQDPGVRIRSGVAGAWFLRVDGYNTQVRVRRIQ